MRLLGVYTGPRYAVRYPNGDRTQPIVVCFLCRPAGGARRADGAGTLARGWFAPDALPPMTVESADIVRDALAERPEAFWRSLARGEGQSSVGSATPPHCLRSCQY